MNALLKVQGCIEDQSALLRFIYNRINVHIRGLNLLGVCSDQYGSLLIPVIMSKLPNDIRLRTTRKTASEVWKMANKAENTETPAVNSTNPVSTNAVNAAEDKHIFCYKHHS